MSNEMTRGNPIKSIIKFAIPILIGNIFQQLYSMVDTIIVGHTINNSALAGVGATGAISFLIIGFVSGMTSGFGVVTSQRFGAGDAAGVKKSVAVSILLSLIFTVVLTALSVVVTKPLLTLMDTPIEIFGYAYDYIIVIFYGLFATVLYNLASNILRALGDSKTPLVFLIIASILNVGFDLLFIIVFKMGVAGAGWATVLSQGLSGVASFIYMFAKYPILRIKIADFKAPIAFAVKHIVIGIPMALQFSIIGIGIMIQQTALNGFGEKVVTAYTAAYKIDQFAVQFTMSLGMALATFCGQNYGAGDFKRIKSGVNKTAALALVFAIIGGIFVIFLAKPLTRLFIADIDEEILNYSQQFLFYQGIFYVVLAGIFVYRSALQGMGYSSITVIACGVELAMRALAAFVLAKAIGYTGICLSNPVAWIGATLLLVTSYYLVIYAKLHNKHFSLQKFAFVENLLPVVNK